MPAARLFRHGANLIDIEELPAQIGQQHTTWDGKDFNGNWVEAGEYTAIIEVEAGDLTCSGTHPITVVQIQLESVTFGGTNKHTLYKKNYPNDPIDRWNPDNEDYASDYALAVPDKAWVRDPALSDPVCYTKGSMGSQCTATIELSIDPAIIEPGATIYGKAGSNTVFLTTASISGSSATVGPMIHLCPFANMVGGSPWTIDWYVNLGEVDDIPAGTSQNDTYLTWGTPSGSQVTAMRMNWAAWLNCSGDTTVTQLADHTASGVQNYTVFGDGNPIPEWAALDNEAPPYSDPNLKNDCLASSLLAKKALQVLGVPSADLGTQVSCASSDKTGDPDYPSDVTDTEYLDWWVLMYTDNDGLDWYNFEGSFRAKDGDIWKYWTCIPLNGPFIGTGANALEKDKSARYQVLDKIRDDNGANFYQKYDGQGQKVSLP